MTKSCLVLDNVLRTASFLSIRDAYSFYNLLYLSNLAAPGSNGIEPVLSADLTLALPNDIDPSAETIFASRHIGWKREEKNASVQAPRIILSGSSFHEPMYGPFWCNLIAQVERDAPGAQILIVLTHLRIEESCKFSSNSTVRVLEGSNATLAEMLWFYKHADVHIGGRFHATTYAILAGIPTLGFDGNTWKVRSLIEPLRSLSRMISTVSVREVDAATVWSMARETIKLSLEDRDQIIISQHLTNLATRNLPLVLSHNTSVSRIVDVEELSYQSSFISSLKVSYGKRLRLCEIFSCCTNSSLT